MQARASHDPVLASGRDGEKGWCGRCGETFWGVVWMQLEGERSEWIVWWSMQLILMFTAFFFAFFLVFGARELCNVPYYLDAVGDLPTDVADEASVGGWIFLFFLVSIIPYVIVLGLTLEILDNYTLTLAISHVSHAVLETIEKDQETRGDYKQAANILTNTVEQAEIVPDAVDAEVLKWDRHRVSQSLQDRIKLAEMYWRYRVVKENEQPLQKAVETLEPARRIYERFKGHHEKEARALEPLLAQIYQGLAVARLIFTPEAAVRNNEHGIKDKIHEDLKRALELRTSHADILGRAETFNSLGMLYKKLRRFPTAQEQFEMSLKLRQKVLEDNKKSAGIHGLLAQSHVSIGTLAEEMATAVADAHGHPPTADEKEQLLRKAVKEFSLAKASYEEELGKEHPKVAWALEGLARVHRMTGELQLAKESAEAAVAIRQALQKLAENDVAHGGGGMVMFSEELETARALCDELEKRITVRKKWGKARDAIQTQIAIKNLLGAGRRATIDRGSPTAGGALLADPADAAKRVGFATPSRGSPGNRRASAPAGSSSSALDIGKV